MKRDLMFVCTGNTCRSPMAEGLAKEILGDDRVILSRGIAVGYEASANDKALQVMRNNHIDISEHRSKAFDPKDVTDNMIVLTMTLRHKLFLISQFPELSRCVMTMSEYTGGEGDIVDPYGYGIDFYEACAQELKGLIEQMIEKDLI